MGDAAPRAGAIEVSRPPMAPAGMSARRRAARKQGLSFLRLQDLALLGWDIAPVESGVVESGAIIVMGNHIPDF
jgi:hypothetical protein